MHQRLKDRCTTISLILAAVGGVLWFVGEMTLHPELNYWNIAGSVIVAIAAIIALVAHCVSVSDTPTPKAA